MKVKNSRYDNTIKIIEDNLNDLVEEMEFMQHAQTAILLNDNYLIKDKETQAVFESILCQNQAKMNPNNHQKAYDFEHRENKISIKSGTVSNGNLKFSYSRTTEHPTLDDKLNYLSTFENLILGLASEKLKCDGDNVLVKVRYHLYYFPANFMDLKSMDWVETANLYAAYDEDSGIGVEIKKKMSDQPWISIPIDKIPCKAVLTFSIMVLNNKKYLTIQREDNGERTHYDIENNRKKFKQIKGMKQCTTSIQKVAMV